MYTQISTISNEINYLYTRYRIVNITILFSEQIHLVSSDWSAAWPITGQNYITWSDLTGPYVQYSLSDLRTN